MKVVFDKSLPYINNKVKLPQNFRAKLDENTWDFNSDELKLRNNFQYSNELLINNIINSEVDKKPCLKKWVDKISSISCRRNCTSPFEIKLLLQNCSEKDLTVAFERNLFEEFPKRTKLLSYKDIETLSKLTEKKWQKVLDLNLLNDYKQGESFSASMILKILELDVQQRNNFFQLLSDRSRPISPKNAIKLAELSQNNYEKIKGFYYIRNNLAHNQSLNTGLITKDNNEPLTEESFISTNTLLFITTLNNDECPLFRYLLNAKAIDVETRDSKISSIIKNNDIEVVKKIKERDLCSQLNSLNESVDVDYLIKIAKLSDEDYDKLSMYKNYFLSKKYIFSSNLDSLMSDNDISKLLYKNYDPELFDIIGEDVIKYSVHLRQNEFIDFIEKIKNLTSCNDNFKVQIKNKINLLSHPEQKLNKVNILLELFSPDPMHSIVLDRTRYKNSEFNFASVRKILSLINSTKTTDEQLLQAKTILSDKNRSNEENIEYFLDSFNVDDSKKDIIRKFLTPLSIDKQLELIEIDIQKINENMSITPAKKNIMLCQLEREKFQLLNNPKDASYFKLTKSSLHRLSTLIEDCVNIPNSNKIFSENMKHLIYEMYDVDTSEDLLKRIEFNGKYFHSLFKRTGFSKLLFKSEFQDLINILQKDYTKPLSLLREELEHNKMTKQMFKENGLDYEKWVKFDSQFIQKIKADSNKGKLLYYENFELSKKTLEIKSFVPVLYKKILSLLNENGFVFDEKRKIFMSNTNDCIDFNSFRKIITLMGNAVDSVKNDIGTFGQHKYTKHFVETLDKSLMKILQLEQKSAGFSGNAIIRLSDDDDIGKNLFFGNEASCCTAIGSQNAYSAIQNLKNTFIRGIEILDEVGNPLGNGLCYFTKLSNSCNSNKLALVIDSFSSGGKLTSDMNVTEGLYDYAKKLVASLGRPDCDIIFGARCNNLNLFNFYPEQAQFVQLVGVFDSVSTYTDFFRENWDKTVGPRTYFKHI